MHEIRGDLAFVGLVDQALALWVFESGLGQIIEDDGEGGTSEGHPWAIAQVDKERLASRRRFPEHYGGFSKTCPFPDHTLRENIDWDEAIFLVENLKKQEGRISKDLWMDSWDKWEFNRMKAAGVIGEKGSGISTQVSQYQLEIVLNEDEPSFLQGQTRCSMDPVKMFKKPGGVLSQAAARRERGLLSVVGLSAKPKWKKGSFGQATFGQSIQDRRQRFPIYNLKK
ncbi:hypothetical protein RHGRI_013025 [Rhododendron griersonianum]|uniref:Uncharacterized protein n=1 Tax=Rhododendron griersonianum TaxID=479676 RepID=A0AAV6K436_9ERIC|nr:hypothetical protein RHGRI_013025 [Rhododendron griersonianum]